jgi:hypothetical protein
MKNKQLSELLIKNSDFYQAIDSIRINFYL